MRWHLAGSKLYESPVPACIAARQSTGGLRESRATSNTNPHHYATSLFLPTATTTCDADILVDCLSRRWVVYSSGIVLGLVTNYVRAFPE